MLVDFVKIFGFFTDDASHWQFIQIHIQYVCVYICMYKMFAGFFYFICKESFKCLTLSGNFGICFKIEDNDN